MGKDDYVFVIFGGASQYSGGDVNEFVWMRRIANQTFHESKRMEHIVGPKMAQAMLYMFCYYKLHPFEFHPGYAKEMDREDGSSVPRPNLGTRLRNGQFPHRSFILEVSTNARLNSARLVLLCHSRSENLMEQSISTTIVYDPTIR
jgi:hypothetical protein